MVVELLARDAVLLFVYLRWQRTLGDSSVSINCLILHKFETLQTGVKIDKNVDC